MKIRKKYLISSLLLLCFTIPALAEDLPKEEKTYVPKIMVESYTGMEFVWVEGGCYQMGCGKWQTDCNDDEKPAHKVCLDGFWIGRYEVTQGQWEKVMENNPSDFKAGLNHPVEMISWNDAQLYIEKMNSLSAIKQKFRLPTEAEWEYAARSGGKNEIYAGGNSTSENLWYHWDWKPGDPLYPEGIQTQPVGSSKPNGLTLYDMSGNVNEWVEDWYSSNYYSSSPAKNPKGPDTGLEKVARGGHHPRNYPRFRTTSRNFHGKPDWNDFATGFRLAAINKE